MAARAYQVGVNLKTEELKINIGIIRLWCKLSNKMEIVVFSVLFKLKDIKTMKLYCSSHEDVIARIGELISLIIYFELLN